MFQFHEGIHIQSSEYTSSGKGDLEMVYGATHDNGVYCVNCCVALSADNSSVDERAVEVVYVH